MHSSEVEGKSKMPQFLNLARPVFAQDISDIGKKLETLPGGPFFPIASMSDFINAIIGAVLILMVILAFFYLIYGCYQWITSAGDQEKITTAHKTITYAIVGLVILFSLWAILALLETIFGIDLIKMTIPGSSPWTTNPPRTGW